MNDSMTASSPIIPAPRSARLQEFWRWWTGELRGLVPARMVAWAIGDVAVTDVFVDAEGIRIVTADPKGTRVPATVPAADIANHPAIRELRAKGNDHVRLLLAADQVLLKTLALPAAIEENLLEAGSILLVV